MRAGPSRGTGDDAGASEFVGSIFATAVANRTAKRWPDLHVPYQRPAARTRWLKPTGPRTLHDLCTPAHNMCRPGRADRRVATRGIQP